ncbi:LuxR C-terminal-related transcriptional regulator [Cohnella sp. GCM10027633]|uniref:LuxR C-terminal-related transcriptional regulator n=1 Tax=unclassified Cohnella TaxID=2636738 RepID=UPI003631F36B
MTTHLERTPVLLHTKTTPPVSRMHLVERQRLTELIEQGVQGRLTLLSAPAGFGKTTALSQWTRRTGCGVAWLSLDEADNDPTRFWRYVSQALSAVLPETTGRRLSQLSYTLPSLSINTFLDAMINELYSADRPAALVLDDYHLIANPGIHENIAYCIEHLPPQLRLVIASRGELPFPTVKWHVRGELATIDLKQLQFTAPEAESFYQDAIGVPLSQSQVESLLTHTEGWITGLQLLGISLRSAGDGEAFMAGFDGYNRDVADYLFHEVMAKLPADMQHFLLRTSVLTRLDARTCDDVTGRNDGLGMLERLQEWNLFLVPLDDQRAWYRYHHLFAEYLRNAARRNSDDLWHDAHAAASASFGARGYLDEAIDHAIAAGDYTAAESYLSRHIATVLQRGEFGALLRWFGSFPPETELASELSLLHAFLLVVTGQPEAAEQTLARVELRLGTTATDEQRKQLQSGILFVKSNLVFASGKFEQWFAFSAGIMDALLPHNPIFYNFNYNNADPLVRRNAFGLKGVLSPDTETIGKQFSGVLEKHGWEASLINLYLVQSLAEGYYEWNRLEESQRLLLQVERASRSRLVPGLYVPNRITQANVYAATGRLELAYTTLEETLAVVLKLPEPQWAAYVRATLLQLHLRHGQLPAAKKLAGALRLSAKDRPTFDLEFEALALSRLLGAQHKEPEALRLLELLKPQAQREGNLMSLAEIAIAQACLQESLGQRALAMAALQEALAIGEANGYVRSFVDAGEVMAKLLRRHAEQGDPSSRYARALLEAYPGTTKQEPASPPPELIEELSRTELQLLELIRQGNSNQVIADKLHLSVGTVKVYVSRLYGKLGVSSRTQALARAKELRLLEEES